MSLVIEVDSGDGKKNTEWSFSDFSEDIEFRSGAAGSVRARQFRHVARITGRRSLYLIDSITADATLFSSSSGDPETSEEGAVKWRTAGYLPSPLLSAGVGVDGAEYGRLTVLDHSVVRETEYGGGGYQEIITWEAVTAWADFELDAF